MKHTILPLFLAFLLLLPATAWAARDKDLEPMADSISNYLREKTLVRSSVSIEKAVIQKNGTLQLNLSRGLVDFPLRDREIRDLYAIAKATLPKKYAQYKNKLALYADKKPIEFYKIRY